MKERGSTMRENMEGTFELCPEGWVAINRWSSVLEVVRERVGVGYFSQRKSPRANVQIKLNKMFQNPRVYWKNTTKIVFIFSSSFSICFYSFYSEALEFFRVVVQFQLKKRTKRCCQGNWEPKHFAKSCSKQKIWCFFDKQGVKEVVSDLMLPFAISHTS